MNAAGDRHAARPSLADLKAELSDRAEDLATTLMGAPNRDTARRAEWRWGAKGSAAFLVQDHHGKRAGSFFSHEGSVGGSPLDFIMFARGCNVAEAIRWAEHWLGYDRPDYVPQPANDTILAERARKRAEQERAANAAAEERVGTARRVWSESVSPDSTPAEIYLIETRRIPMPSLGWSDVVRFHPRSRSLVVAATDAAGDVHAVQRVFLTPDGRKIGDEERERRNLPAVKMTNGVMEGAAVRLPARTLGARPDAPILLAEGPETALSVWASTGHETWIALGGLGKLTLSAGRPYVACRDDDARFSNADKLLRRVLATWRGAGLSVAIAAPWSIRRFDKSDFNDLLQAQGALAVQRRIEKLTRAQTTPIQRESIAVVRTRLDEAVEAFFERAVVWCEDGGEETSPEFAFPDGAETLPGEEYGNEEPPPAHAVRVEVGAGKSRAAHRHAVRMLERLRAAGDNRAIAIAVPTHKLGDEQAAIFDRLANPDPAPDPVALGHGVTARALVARRVVRVWRGMDAVDPDHSDADNDAVLKPDKTRMCRRLDAVKEAHAAHLDAFSACCQRKVGGETIRCPLFGQCGYQRQRQADADLWIVPHELLFLTKPSSLGQLAALVVDESAWQDGLEGVNGKPMVLALEDLRQPVTISWKGKTERFATDRLGFLRAALVDVLEQHSDGPLMREVLDGFNLTSANAGEAYRLEWRRMVDPGMHPGMTLEERKEAAQAAKGNAAVMRLAKVWKGVQALLAADGPMKSGWLSLASEPDDRDGSIKRVLQLKGRREVKKGWQVPTLLLDATMDVNLVRPFWPQVEMVSELLAAAPHQHVRQVVDRAYAKSMLDPITSEMIDTDPRVAALVRNKPDEPERRARNLRSVHAILCREARRYAPERVLVVCQKAVTAALPDVGPLPANVELAWHNNVAGRDEWGPQPDRAGIRALIVVGRTLPAIGAVRRQAEALGGAAISDVSGGWYDRGDAIREGLDGHAEVTETERHPDALAEAIRWQICEGELVQIIGRGRGVNRTAENPLDVLVLTDAPLPVPVAETISAADLNPTPDDMMAASGGVVLRNARHAAAAYPELWGTHKAAERAFQRSHPNSYEYILLIGERVTPRLDAIAGSVATYRLAGAGQKPVEAWLDRQTVDDPKVWLTVRLGPLALFQLDGPNADQAPSANFEGSAEMPVASIASDLGAAVYVPPSITLPFHYLAGRRLAPVGDVWTVRQRDGTRRDIRPPGMIELPPLIFSTGPDGRRLASKTILFGVQGDAELSRPHPSGRIPDVVIEMKQQPSAGAAA